MMKDNYSVLLLKPMNDKHYTKTFLIDNSNFANTYPSCLGAANWSQVTGKCHLLAYASLGHFVLSWYVYTHTHDNHSPPTFMMTIVYPFNDILLAEPFIRAVASFGL